MSNQMIVVIYQVKKDIYVIVLYTAHSITIATTTRAISTFDTERRTYHHHHRHYYHRNKQIACPTLQSS